MESATRILSQAVGKPVVVALIVRRFIRFYQGFIRKNH